jgi:hypothetical protein
VRVLTDFGRSGAGPWACGAAAALLAVLVFSYVVNLDFYLDDYLHLYRLTNGGYLRLVLPPHAGHAMLTSNTVFFALYRLFGTAASNWFIVLLLMHAINTLLLFRLLHAWTARAVLAGLLTALWAVSPINQGVLSWLANYGHVLVATFILWILGDIARLPDRGIASLSAGVRVRWLVLLFAAATSWGFGLGIALASPVAAFWLLRPFGNRRKVVLACAGNLVAVGMLYMLGRWTTVRYWGAEAISYDVAPLVPQLEAAARFIRLAGSTFLDLVGYGLATLLLGPVAIEGRQWLGPWVWLFSVALAAAAAALAGIAEPRRRDLVLALAVLVVGCYSGAALVGALRTLAVPGVVFSYGLEGRYHYVGPALLTSLLGVLLAIVLDRWRRLAAPCYAGLTIWLATAAPWYWSARDNLVGGHRRSPNWERQSAALLKRIRVSVQDHPVGVNVYFENQSAPLPFLGNVPQFPGLAAMFVVMDVGDVIAGRHVRFVERDPELLRFLESHGGRIATLIAGPEEVPGKPIVLRGARRAPSPNSRRPAARAPPARHRPEGAAPTAASNR